ncbi:hypothetical protein [Thalassobacillus sp. C254]|uniref:hypothetical protein n=1 Tax=Thalassobacillus sp. C254 TaxID=1225341 RepID=UPI0018DC213B|nr:hypothetical protein [Thalassobacillus sp. C254]
MFQKSAVTVRLSGTTRIGGMLMIVSVSILCDQREGFEGDRSTIEWPTRSMAAYYFGAISRGIHYMHLLRD